MTDFLTSTIGQKILALVEACGGRYDDAGTAHRGIMEDIESDIEDLEREATFLGEEIQEGETLRAIAPIREVARCGFVASGPTRLLHVLVTTDLWNRLRAYLPEEARKP